MRFDCDPTDLLSLLNESFAVLFSLFCSSNSSDNVVLAKLKVKFPVKKIVKREVKEHAELNIIRLFAVFKFAELS